MKKKILVSFILSVSILSALAVTPVQEDSLEEFTKHLEEIVIKSDNQYKAKDKDFNISFRANNPFRSSWAGAKKEIRANNYMQVARVYSGNYLCTFTVSVSYSFSYGKKVLRTNAPGAGNGVGSAILK